MALATIEEEPPDVESYTRPFDESGGLSHASSVTTVCHISDDEDDIYPRKPNVLSGLNPYGPENELPSLTLGRLCFCIFDMRRPTKKWLMMLEQEHLQPAFLCALDYYTQKKQDYRFIYENIYLMEAPESKERYSLWIKRVCMYVLKELRTQYCQRQNEKRPECEPR